MTITRERLVELLKYDEGTGDFFWLENRKKNPYSGMKAGTIYKSKHNPGTGYIAIIIDGRRYLAHRLAWLWVYGYVPDFDIDHDNGDGLNNRIGNLRECTVSQNHMNRCRLGKNNKSGFKGVAYVENGKWHWYIANITLSGKTKYLGLFKDAKQAALAYDVAATAAYGSFAKTNAMLGLI